VPAWAPERPEPPRPASPTRPGLPPAYIEVAQLGMFRDEDLAYPLRLGQAGVPRRVPPSPRRPHEFDFIAFNTAAQHGDREPGL